MRSKVSRLIMPGKSNNSPTILVVDDFEELRSTLRLWLEQRGYKVVEAGDGEEAIEVARLEHPVLILMDLGMSYCCGKLNRLWFSITQGGGGFSFSTLPPSFLFAGINPPLFSPSPLRWVLNPFPKGAGKKRERGRAFFCFWEEKNLGGNGRKVGGAVSPNKLKKKKKKSYSNSLNCVSTCVSAASSCAR